MFPLKPLLLKEGIFALFLRICLFSGHHTELSLKLMVGSENE